MSRGGSIGLLVALSALAAGCGDGDDPLAPPPVVEQFIVSVVTGDEVAPSNPGSPPAASGGPAVSVSGNETVINGGVLPVTLTASQPIDRVIVTVQGADGWFDLEVPAGAQGPSVPIALLLSPAQPSPAFVATFAAESGGKIGPATGKTLTVASGSPGQVQVVLSWDKDSDLDLHVIDPDGEELFYADPLADSGGRLESDSNRACVIDGRNTENVRWIDDAPRGSYTVRVDNRDSCGQEPIGFTVRVRREGFDDLVFSGEFTGPGTGGGLGSGRTITTFAF